MPPRTHTVCEVMLEKASGASVAPETGLRVFEFFGRGRSLAQTPEDETTEATDVAATSVSLVVIDAVAEGGASVVAHPGQLNIVRLRTARHFFQAPAGLPRFVAR